MVKPIAEIKIYDYGEFSRIYPDVPSFGGDEDYVVVLEMDRTYEVWDEGTLAEWWAEQVALMLDCPKSPKAFKFRGKSAWVTHHA